LKGPKVGQWDTFIDNLPAFVDNITPTRDAPGFWAAGVVTRAETLFDFTADKPWMRLLFAKVIFLSYMYACACVSVLCVHICVYVCMLICIHIHDLIV